LFFSPTRCSESAVLEEREGDHGHQRVAVKAFPGSAFEVVEAEFFLELLMGLFADPARLDRGGESFEISVERDLDQIVFSFAGSAPFADEPGLYAGQMLHAFLANPLWRSIGHAHPGGGEAQLAGLMIATVGVVDDS
jgi:hypothetical protein